jgi:hypothetical protein
MSHAPRSTPLQQRRPSKANSFQTDLSVVELLIKKRNALK